MLSWGKRIPLEQLLYSWHRSWNASAGFCKAKEIKKLMSGLRTHSKMPFNAGENVCAHLFFVFSDSGAKGEFQTPKARPGTLSSPRFALQMANNFPRAFGDLPAIFSPCHKQGGGSSVPECDILPSLNSICHSPPHPHIPFLGICIGS